MPTIWHLLKNGPIDPENTFGIPDDPSSSSSTSSAQSSSPAIDEIWFFDDIHHGESIDLNAGQIGSVHSWSDGGRDMINFIEHVLPAADAGSASANSTADEGEGVSLQWLPKENVANDRSKRRVIGVGHSVGGNAMYVHGGGTPQSARFGVAER
jgi:hypothetical protein